MGIRQLTSSPEVEFDRVHRLLFFGPSTILHVVIMIRPLVAIGVLVVLAAVADASYRHDSYEDNKYDHDYKHEPQYYKEKYHKPTYEKYDDGYGYEEPTYDNWPMYKYKTMKSGYGGDSYGKSYSSYEDDYYGDDSYDHSYRHKRAATEESVGVEGFMEPELTADELAAIDASREALEGDMEMEAIEGDMEAIEGDSEATEGDREGQRLRCRTRSRKMCRFPFKYRGRKFWRCTKFGKKVGGIGWCATRRWRNGNMRNWSKCRSCVA